jgi:hypothetical protein
MKWYSSAGRIFSGLVSVVLDLVSVNYAFACPHLNFPPLPTPQSKIEEIKLV